MMNWKIKHVVIGIGFSVVAAISGYYFGIILADPPLDVSAQQSLLLQAVKNAVSEEVGISPSSIKPLGGESPVYGSLSGDVLSVQPQSQYFIVDLRDENQMKASLVEGIGEDVPHGDIDHLRVVEITPEGETRVLNVRI